MNRDIQKWMIYNGQYDEKMNHLGVGGHFHSAKNSEYNSISDDGLDCIISNLP